MFADFEREFAELSDDELLQVVSFCCEKFLLALAATVLTFFIAGLLYLLCLEHVDNLGAYTASRPETGLLISSVIANHGNLDVRRGVLEPVSSLSRGGRRLLSN